ncbi:MAG: hypothetical protein KatS3mg113_1128 [Planctomycetaceae bacterium]|nr:MAG: hypothetical protein KatS3mg113_1128 [Planctomycetaceae bacterium]
MRWNDIHWYPTSHELRWFAGLQVVFWALVGGWLWRHGWSGVAQGLLLLSCALAVWGLVRPQHLLPIYRSWMLAVFPIGWLVSHLMLALVFYGVMTPVGWLVRVFRGDPLQRHWEHDKPSYWERRSSAASGERYFQQF